MNDRLHGGLGRWFWISWTIAMAWSLYRCLTNQSWILDDELAHYLISKDVWESGKELWHPWSRPGRNILQFIPAHFGLTAARLWTLALAGLAIWLTGREGKRLGMTGLAVLPILVGFQWWFPELSYPVLTQTPFMIVWIAAIFFAMRDRMVLAALCWGYLPLVRHEGIALSAMFGLWIIFGPGGFARLLAKGKWREAGGAFPKALWLGFWTFVPLIVMNVASGLTRGEWPFLMFFEAKPTEFYGSGPIWLYLRHLAVGAGIPVVLLMIYGALMKWENLNWKLVLWGTYPAYLAMHSLIYWKGLFASGGYYHFIMPMAPFVGLVALRGFNGIAKRYDLKVAAFVLASVVLTGLMMPQQQFGVSDNHIEGMPNETATLKPIAPPMKLSRFGMGIKDASEWVRENADGVDVLAHHVGVDYWLDGWKGSEMLASWGGYTPESPQLKAGTILVWDAQYSVQESFGFVPERIESSGWELLESYAHGTVRIYRKL
ncbi:hypothetical protein V2O64_09055 [Verrucomicrobiaceae bacterium 227]